MNDKGKDSKMLAVKESGWRVGEFFVFLQLLYKFEIISK